MSALDGRYILTNKAIMLSYANRKLLLAQRGTAEELQRGRPRSTPSIPKQLYIYITMFSSSTPEPWAQEEYWFNHEVQ